MSANGFSLATTHLSGWCIIQYLSSCPLAHAAQSVRKRCEPKTKDVIMTLATHTKGQTMNSTINIPGTLTAIVKNGRVVSYIFDIAANDAGYFGPAFITIDGDEMSNDAISDAIANSLMLSQDGQSGFFSVEVGA